MSEFEYEKMSPSDAIATIRSLPRRFKESTAPLDEADAQTLTRPGPAGVSVAGHVSQAAAALTSVAADLASVQRHDSPTISGRPHVSEPESVEDALGQLNTAAERLTATAQQFGADEWTRTGVSGSESVRADALLRHAVSFALGQLKLAEEVRAETRSR